MKRVWIYQSNRFLTADEEAQVKGILAEFVQQWTAHGSQLAGSFEIRYGLFIFLYVDEEMAMVTGCSIDKSVQLLKQIESALQINLFDRMLLAYRDEQQDIQVVSRNRFEELMQQGLIHKDSIVFNNMLTTSTAIAEKWEVPLKDSWHAQLFL